MARPSWGRDLFSRLFGPEAGFKVVEVGPPTTRMTAGLGGHGRILTLLRAWFSY
jgi:hypothetical protein